MSDVSDEIIPIARLFFDDAGPHIVSSTMSPLRDSSGTTLAEFDAKRTVGRSTPPIGLSAVPATPSPRYTPARGRELQSLLGTSIAQLRAVSGATRKTPTPAPAVPIASLLYRGRAALARALEIRYMALSSNEPLSSGDIDELLDLIGLAAEE